MCNICLLNIWPLTVTLTLSWHMGNMGSAHPLVGVNVSFKFEGNPSISKEVIERTRIGRRTDRPTDATKRIQYSPPPTFCGGGIIMKNKVWSSPWSTSERGFCVLGAHCWTCPPGTGPATLSHQRRPHSEQAPIIQVRAKLWYDEKIHAQLF